MARKPRDKSRELQQVTQSLTDSVYNGDCVLLLGSEIVLDRNVIPSSGGDSSSYLLDCVVDTQKENGHILRRAKNFSELIVDNGLNVEQVKKWILREIDENIEFVIDDVAPDLRKLLTTRLFRVVLTTTVDPYIESIMEKVWGKGGYRVMNINNSPANNFDLPGKDVRGDEYNEILPTLYYVFGKADPKEPSKKFAIADNDTMETITKWLVSPPGNLMEYIRRKKILAIGCNLNDWCFRFFWYAMRKNGYNLANGDIALLLNTSDSESDKNLHNYLQNTIGIHVEVNSHDFLNQLTERLDEERMADETLINSTFGGIFISYSHKDFPTAWKIFRKLKAEGFNVWLDNSKLQSGNAYDLRIRNAIQQCKIFLPILTPNVADDLLLNKSTYYRKEWELACGVNNEIKIMPVMVFGYNMRASYHKDVPEKFSSATIFEWDKDPFSIFISHIKQYFEATS